MKDTLSVHAAPPIRRVPVNARYPEDRRHLLKHLQTRLGYEHLSDLVAEALDEKLQRHGYDLPEAA